MRGNNWRQALDEFREIQISLTHAAPYRDAGVVPNPAASAAQIAEAEARLGQALPPSYRSFLERHNGWPRFFEGASILSTTELGTRSYNTLARAALEASESPLAPETTVTPIARRPTLIPFAADAQATTLFAFNTERESRDGELEVVAWVNELGVSAPNFTSFLGLLVRLCRHELEDIHALNDRATFARIA